MKNETYPTAAELAQLAATLIAGTLDPHISYIPGDPVRIVQALRDAMELYRAAEAYLEQEQEELRNP